MKKVEGIKMGDSKDIKISYDEYSDLSFTNELIVAFVGGLLVLLCSTASLEFGIAIATTVILLCIRDVRFGLIMMKHRIKNLECYKKRK